jgi:hypothetical protein
MDSDAESAGERWAHLQRLVKEYRATRKRHLAEIAEKLWPRMERQGPGGARSQPPPTLH